MKRLFFLLIFSATAFAEYREGEVLVRFKDTKSFKAADYEILSKEPVFDSSDPILSSIYKLKFSKDRSVSDVITLLKEDPNVVYAEPNYIRSVCVTPNDPKFSWQWGLSKISAEPAWDIEKGRGSVIIAIVDTGIDYNHEDLSGKVIKGYDFVNSDTDPADDHGHGTHIAGIAGAVTNNGIGVAGLAWNCKLLAIKCLNSEGKETDDSCARAVQYAADYGADVINMSWGGTDHSETLKTACDYAYNRGCLLVAAAGNDGEDVKYYPAAYSNVIAVAATDSSDKKAWFSNYGDWIDVAAPGDDIYSTEPGNDYWYDSGTSQATPYVAALCALLFSKHPSWTNTQVAERIKEKAEDIGDGLGAGRINAYRALSTDAEWCIMVWLDGDNNLEKAAIDDFLEMASVALPESVKVVLQFDRIDGYSSDYGNWKGAKRFCITEGMTPDPVNAEEDLGEVNMGDPQALVDFVNWVKNEYLAERYALIFWNHGGGWRNRSKGIEAQEVCVDDTSEDWLYTKELRTALSAIGRLDLIGFDACYMAMAEVAYEIKKFAEIMVASEEEEPEDGWCYDLILSELAENPNIDARDLAGIIVQEYSKKESTYTLSAIELGKISAFASSLDIMAESLSSNWREVWSKRRVTECVDSKESYADILHFAELVGESLTDPVVYNYSPEDREFKGLTIYFPKERDTEYEDYTPENLRFCADRGWDEFLEGFLSYSPKGTIAGAVTYNSAPISGVTIEVLQDREVKASVTTGVGGMFSIPDLKIGTYCVKAKKLNYRIEKEVVIVKEDVTSILEFEMEPVSGPEIERFLLGLGNRWVYRKEKSLGTETYIGTLTWHIAGTKTISDVETHIIRKELKEKGELYKKDEYKAQVDNELREYGYEMVEGAFFKSNMYYVWKGMRFRTISAIIDYIERGREKDLVIYSPPRLLLKYPLTCGDSWTWFTQPQKAYREIPDVEDIQVPAGSFTTYKVEIVYPGSAGEGLRFFEWYGEGGLVKREIEVEEIGIYNENGECVGTVSYSERDELLSFTPPELTLTPSFSEVSADASISYRLIVDVWNVTDKAEFSTTDPLGSFTDNLYHPAKAGTWTIFATYTDLVATATVVVKPGRLHTISISAPSTVTTHQPFAITLSAKDGDGNYVYERIRIDDRTGTIEPKEIELFGTVTQIIATITASPNCGTDTIRVGTGGVAGSVELQVFIDPTKEGAVKGLGVEVGFFENTFEHPVIISIAETSTADPPNQTIISAYNISATSKLTGSCTITFSYRERDGVVEGTEIREEDICVWHYDGGWNAWDAERDPLSNTITITTGSLSIFVLSGTPTYPVRIIEPTVYPNPYIAEKHRFIIFGDPTDVEKRLTRYGTIKIYNIAGELVKELFVKPEDCGIKRWREPKIASGIYIYLIKGEDSVAVGKIGIVR
jgi:thermitase